MKPSVLRTVSTVVLTGVAALMLSGCTALSALSGAPDRPARQSHNSSSLSNSSIRAAALRRGRIRSPSCACRCVSAWRSCRRRAVRAPPRFSATNCSSASASASRTANSSPRSSRSPTTTCAPTVASGDCRACSACTLSMSWRWSRMTNMTHMDENKWSLGYLTIVGAYVLKGSHHDVATLVDLAVVDPVTQSLILRAGGTDSRNRNTTLIDQEREARESGAASFGSATTQMIDNFDAALTSLKPTCARAKPTSGSPGAEQRSCGRRSLGPLVVSGDPAGRARRAPSVQPGVGTPSEQSHTLLLPMRAILRQPLTFLHITRQPSNRALSACKAAGDCVEWAARKQYVHLGITMRIALTTTLMMLAALALADEPSAPESKTEAYDGSCARQLCRPAGADRDHGQGRDTRREAVQAAGRL